MGTPLRDDVDHSVCGMLGANHSQFGAHYTARWRFSAAVLDTHIAGVIYHPFHGMLGTENAASDFFVPNDCPFEQLSWAHRVRYTGTIPATACLRHTLFPRIPANMKVGCSLLFFRAACNTISCTHEATFLSAMLPRCADLPGRSVLEAESSVPVYP